MNEIHKSKKQTVWAKKLLIRGLIAIVVSGIIALLLKNGMVQPHPNLKVAYIICLVVGTWGLIDLINSTFRFSKS